MRILAILYCLGNQNEKKKKLYMFRADVFLLNIFILQLVESMDA